MRLQLLEMMPNKVTSETGQSNVDQGTLFHQVLGGLIENLNGDDPSLLSEEGDSQSQKLTQDVQNFASLLSEEDASVLQKLIKDIQHLVPLLSKEIEQELEHIDPQLLENMKQVLLELENTEVTNPLDLLKKLEEFSSLVAESPVELEHNTIQQLHQLGEKLTSILGTPEAQKYLRFDEFKTRPAPERSEIVPEPTKTVPERPESLRAVQPENEWPKIVDSTEKQKQSPIVQLTKSSSLQLVNNQMSREQQLNLGLIFGRQAYQEHAAPRISIDRDSPFNMGLTEAHTKQYLSRLLDDGVQEPEGRALVRKLVSVLRNAHFSNTHQTKQLTIRLYPEHLGMLRVELFQKEGEMVARIIASTQMAKKLLDSNLQQLKHGLVNHNIQIEKVDVTHQPNIEKHPYFDGKQGQNEQQEEQHSEQTHKEKKEKNEQHFSIVLNDAIFETEV